MAEQEKHDKHDGEYERYTDKQRGYRTVDSLTEREVWSLRGHMRKDVYDNECKEAIEKFVGCSKERTVTVAWACRDLYKAMNACLASKNTEERLNGYKQRYIDEWNSNIDLALADIAARGKLETGEWHEEAKQAPRPWFEGKEDPLKKRPKAV